MFNVARYQPSDEDFQNTQDKGLGLDSVLERAKQRQKRKRQEESFQSRANEIANIKQNAKNKAKATAPVRPVRSESLEERNTRKASMKASRRDKEGRVDTDKDSSLMHTHTSSGKSSTGAVTDVASNSSSKKGLVELSEVDLDSTAKEILAVQIGSRSNGNSMEKKRKKDVKRARKDSIESDTSTTTNANSETSGAMTSDNKNIFSKSSSSFLVHSLQKNQETENMSKNMELEDDDENDEVEDENIAASKILNSNIKTDPAAFVKQLTRASKEAVTRVVRIDDEDDEAMDTQEPIAPAPPPMSIVESLKQWEVSQILIDNLQSMGITDFFPVQRSVIPSVIRSHSIPYVQPRDMCVSAPTGSGKTIAYTIPILQTLMSREVVRLRALILVPSRDLAVQVFTVMKKLSKNTGLKIVMVTGQQSFEEEQSLLVGNLQQQNSSNNPRSTVTGFSFSTNLTNQKHWKGNSNGRFRDRSNSRGNMRGEGGSENEQAEEEEDGYSVVDILVCTPGRLLDHIEYTTGFTLQHVRFLVLDEADRLLSNAYHGWIKSVVQGVQTVRTVRTVSHMQYFQNGKLNNDINDTNNENRQDLSISGFLNQSTAVPLQRMLFSATLTDNPRKLAMLNIRNPEIIRARAADAGALGGEGESEDKDKENEHVLAESGDSEIITGFILPSTLSESMATCDAARRPVLLTTVVVEALKRVNYLPAAVSKEGETLPSESEVPSRHAGHVICKDLGDMILIFASSVDTVHRLSHLLKLINRQDLKVDNDIDAMIASMNTKDINKKYLFGGGVVEINRTVKADEREKIMELARCGKVAVLVASDNLARGIDLPNIKLVINYDSPKFARSYVHRCGRTARANRFGHCLTLLKEGQVGAFKKMRSQIATGSGASSGSVATGDYQLNKCKPGKLTESRVSALVSAALKLLPASLKAEDIDE